MKNIYYYIAHLIFLLTFFTLLLTAYGLLKDGSFYNISLGETVAAIYYGLDSLWMTRGSHGVFFKSSWYGIDSVLNYVFIQANGIIVGLILGGFFLFISEYSNE
jgi:hypothetical protein